MNDETTKITDSLTAKTAWCEPCRAHITTLEVNGKEVWRSPVPKGFYDSFINAIKATSAASEVMTEQQQRVSDEYDALVNKVELIDAEAAEYMRTKAPKLSRFTRCGNIYTAFVWSQTPQGADYWLDIFERLNA